MRLLWHFLRPLALPLRTYQMRLSSVLVLVLFAGQCLASRGVPYIPANDDVVLQQVPSTVDPRVRQFESLRTQWQRNPADLASATALAIAYLDYARGTGDARYLGRADAIVAPWLKNQPPPIPAMLIDATILQSRHLFTESRAELIEILRRDADTAQAWLTLAAVAQVQGDMGATRSACAHLIAAGDALVAGACLGGLNAVTGHPREAYQTIQFVLQQDPKAAPLLQSWAQGLLADTAQYAGDYVQAEAHYQAALQLSPGDNFLLVDYADFLLDHKRPQEVVNLLKDYTQSDTCFLRLVMAEKRLGLPQAQDDANQMAARFAATDQRGSYLYRREEALFALAVQQNPEQALDLAQQNWSVQKAPQDVHILLQAALGAGKSEAAQPVLDFIDKTGLREPAIDALVSQLRKAVPPISAKAAS
jgi:tetratricopeptide (TPR) repeat protein